jgi:hypothetical protein
MDGATGKKKACITCGAVKALSEFPFRAETRDKRRGECNECYRRKMRHLTRRWAAKHPDRRRERNEAVDPAKLAAQQAVGTALRSGRLVRPGVCEDCGAIGGRIEAYHEDYGRQLDVRWLCKPCHWKADRKLANAA